MTEWKKLGLKCGLEIHQQLDTKHKLFCGCSTVFSEMPLEGGIVRKLRPVAGETGEVDEAARHESLRNNEFFYKVYPGESCLVEADEQPPLELNREALEIALEIALLLHCELPQEIHVMRKIVIDGSNTGGFQRTAIVGLDGWLDTSFGRVGIPSVALEEDSAQILSREGKKVFGLNRLGIPLVEIGTSPDILTPGQGKEVAEKLGMLLRSSRVKRGLGTIRQDLNVSVQGGARVEIKGVQDLKAIPRIIEKEAERQLALMEAGRPVAKEVRKAEPDSTTTFLRPLPGAARLYPETDCLPLVIPQELVERSRASLPELLDTKRERLEKELGVGQDILKALERNKKTELFMRLSRLKSINPSFTAKILLSYGPEIKKKNKGAKPELVSERDMEAVFERLGRGEIAKDSVLDILAELALGKKLDFSKHSLEKTDIEKEVRELVESRPGLTFGAYMGILMGKFRGKVSGDEISKALKKRMG